MFIGYLYFLVNCFFMSFFWYMHSDTWGIELLEISMSRKKGGEVVSSDVEN